MHPAIHRARVSVNYPKMNLYCKYMELAPSIQYGLLCISALVIWMLVASLTLPFLCVFKIFQWFQERIISYYKLGMVLESNDVPFLHENEHNRNYICGLFVVNGVIDVKELRKLMMSRVVENSAEPSYARMRKLVKMYYWRYVWQDEPEFDITRHVFNYEGDPPRSEDQLQELLSQRFSLSMSDDMSPWEVMVAPLDLPGKDQTAICMRIHHAIGDAFSLIGLFSNLMVKKPEFLGVKKPVVTACDKRKQRLSGEKCTSWTSAIDLGLVKEIKTKTGTTINDVLSTCLAGSLRRYLTSEGLQENPTDIQIAVTVNSRPSRVLSRDKIPLENHSTGLLYSLPVSMADTLERLIETKRRMDNLKASSHWRIFGFVYSHVVGRLPEFIGRFSSFSLKRHCSVIFSNVPGPLSPFEINGQEVATALAWPPLVSDTGISVAVLSYAGTLRMSVLSDKAVIANPNNLTHEFELELKKMYECVKNSSACVDATTTRKYF
ncbi:putative diacylglycerol O-acyltransferase [Acropora cervicornis]|uniref:Diacylglycerol O-acyltransferase n=1 Tax=Acropora cervicornis TaxID=6130 RepID=A0AAD9R729_ACRCE|nr:putative diacylglycerol O-acyltransferase [Acropora cervicornis]